MHTGPCQGGWPLAAFGDPSQDTQEHLLQSLTLIFKCPVSYSILTDDYEYHSEVHVEVQTTIALKGILGP